MYFIKVCQSIFFKAAQITFSDTKWTKSEVCEFDLKSTEPSCNRSEINSDKIFNLDVSEKTQLKICRWMKMGRIQAKKKHLQLSQVWKIYLGDIIHRGILFILSVWKEKSRQSLQGSHLFNNKTHYFRLRLVLLQIKCSHYAQMSQRYWAEQKRPENIEASRAARARKDLSK